MTGREIRRLCVLDRDGVHLLDRAYERLRLSARACDRVIKVAQTIADLAGAPTIAAAHVGRESFVPCPERGVDASGGTDATAAPRRPQAATRRRATCIWLARLASLRAGVVQYIW